MVISCVRSWELHRTPRADTFPDRWNNIKCLLQNGHSGPTKHILGDVCANYVAPFGGEWIEGRALQINKDLGYKDIEGYVYHKRSIRILITVVRFSNLDTQSPGFNFTVSLKYELHWMIGPLKLVVAKEHLNPLAEMILQMSNLAMHPKLRNALRQW